jgi:hypothetical protein
VEDDEETRQKVVGSDHSKRISFLY